MNIRYTSEAERNQFTHIRRNHTRTKSQLSITAVTVTGQKLKYELQP